MEELFLHMAEDDFPTVAEGKGRGQPSEEGENELGRQVPRRYLLQMQSLFSN